MKVNSSLEDRKCTSKFRTVACSATLLHYYKKVENKCNEIQDKYTSFNAMTSQS